ncbi:MAG: M50 family metallopeptidase [Planctomycetaceae bacterium]
MSSVLNALTSSFPVGTFLKVRARVAFSLIALYLLILLKSADLLVGFSLILLFTASVLFQQLIQYAVIRKTGGDLIEFLLWPLGSLAKLKLGFSLKGRILTWAITPLTHALVCLSLLPFLYHSALLPSLWNLAALPVPSYSLISFSRLGLEFLALAFYVNWVLMVMSLLPVFPLSGGRIVEEMLLLQFNSSFVNRLMYGFTNLSGFFLLFFGIVVSQSWFCLFGTILICWTLYERIRLLETTPAKDETELFLGYDFSAGYTSLEQSSGSEIPVQRPTRPGMIARWKAKRKQQQRVRAAARRAHAQEQIDLLLAKVSESGMSSLTAAEHKQLKQASQYLKPQQSK